MIWVAVSVFFVCTTVLLIAWRAEPLVLRAFVLAERPKPTWEHSAWRSLLGDCVSQIVVALHDRKEPVFPLVMAEKAIASVTPLVERWLALKESELAEAHKPAPKPDEVPMLPPDLLNAANQWSDEWARESTAKALQELGIKYNGDWSKVRAAVMTDPLNG